MSKFEDIIYLTACIKSSNYVQNIEHIFIEMIELLAKGTKYNRDINEALEHYNELKDKISEGKIVF